MTNTNKSEKKAPRRRYFRRSGAKTNGSQPVNESASQAKTSNELSTSEKSKRSSSSDGHTESRSKHRRSRSEKRRARAERGDSAASQRSDGGLRRRSNSDARRRRQKRRRGEREDTIVEQVTSGPSIIEAIAREYEPPEDIYTYTHIIRSDQRDTYEFRSDHFSNTTRHLEDYAIDLSPILTETGEIALKKFFQDIPYDEDWDRINLKGSLKKSTINSKADSNTTDRQKPTEDDFEKAFDAFYRDDFQDDLEEDIEEDEEKSLEQIYDELEMFTDMEI